MGKEVEAVMYLSRNLWFTLSILIAGIFVTGTDNRALGQKAPIVPPDLTRGETRPPGASHDWLLGPTGARGWMFCDKMVTTDARQILVTKIDQGSPADGVLMVGDIILGVGGTLFKEDPRLELGKAIGVAESAVGGGQLKIQRWRDGSSQEVIIELPVIGAYSDTAPHSCTKSAAVFESGIQALAVRMRNDRYNPPPIPRALNALALLASGNPDYRPLLEREAQWAASFETDGFQSWHYGYVMLFLAEYKLATGDDQFMPGLERLALAVARGQSIVGSWGHKFAGADGRLVGYGMMNSPGVPLTLALHLTEKAGLRNDEIRQAIQRSTRLLRFYVDKGAIPYGDHDPWIETHEDNGKCGMAAVLFNAMDDDIAATFFARMSLASHGPERDTGHTGNYFNMLWAMPSISLLGNEATGAWMQEFGGWYFDLARDWQGNFHHQGPPEPTPDSYRGWDASGAFLLAYATAKRLLYITGRDASKKLQLERDQALMIIEDGRGWSNKNRYEAYDSLDTDALLQRLDSWSPVVRERAAMALGRRKEVDVQPLIDKLSEASLSARLGACQALAHLRNRAAPAVPTLVNTLDEQDLWLRIKAAEALTAIGPAANSTIPKLLHMLAFVDKEKDPRGMQQRYFSYAIFNERGGMLGRSLEGVDREQLYEAVRAGLLNEDGRARGSFVSVYKNLSFAELRPILPEIHRAIVEPAPSGIMFADSIRTSGLELFARHRIDEGLELIVDYARNQKKHGSEKRISQLMDLLTNYGANAQRVVPEMESLVDYFENEEEDFPKHLSRGKAEVVRTTINELKKATFRPVTTSLNELTE